MANFEQAIEWLKQRRKVRREGWSKGKYIYCDCDMIKHEDSSIYSVHISCVDATDWEIYEEKPKGTIDQIIYNAVKGIREPTEEEKKIFDAWYEKEFS